jgi:hypothetical protein
MIKDSDELERACVGGITNPVVPVDQIAPTLVNNAGAHQSITGDAMSLMSERDGYKQAYETLSTEVGRLRMLAGPARVRSPGEAGQGIGKPSIMVVSLPKSGTVYTGAALAMTLGYDYAGRPLTSGTFPKDIVWPEIAQDFAKGGMVCTSHLQAEQRNLTLLQRAGITRGVLLVRDLRSALFSWFHYYIKANLHCR